ncbi:MAG: hypothetical protein NT031_06735, partial [Planctomycetota bacterium]|nr:hypothetical protein [Planctomycetota bacterium]
MSKPAVGTAEAPVIFWASDPIRPGQTLMIHGHAFGDDALVEAAPAPGMPRQELAMLGRSTQCLKALIPADWQAGVYECQVRTASGQAAVLLNRPADLWWVGDLGNRQTPGGRFRICGRNLVGDVSAIRVRLTGPKNVEATVVQAEPFTLTAQLPGETPLGQYHIQVHNGWGAQAGWSEPIPFLVERATAWPQTVFDVTAYGATGRGLADDTAAVQAALDAAGA